MAAAAAAVTVAGLAACSSSSNSGQASGPQTITVAVVNNPQMIDIQKLTPKGFTASHPNIKVKYVTLDENTLRDQVTKDVAAGGGQFDVVVADPPYDLTNDVLADVLTGLHRAGLLSPHADLVIERGRKSGPPEWPDPLEGVRTKKYGDTLLCYGRAP